MPDVQQLTPLTYRSVTCRWFHRPGLVYWCWIWCCRGMPNWNRAHVPGGTYFFTVVTDQRWLLFASAVARQVLGDVLRQCRWKWPFEMRAIVLLPDHLHAIWVLPPGDDRYSGRWGRIKRDFTKCWLSAGGTQAEVRVGRRRDGRRGVWQPKFWEYTLEGKSDFERHFDYIHYNSVTYGYVRCPSNRP